jgi:hypothetical protein
VSEREIPGKEKEDRHLMSFMKCDFGGETRAGSWSEKDSMRIDSP